MGGCTPCGFDRGYNGWQTLAMYQVNCTVYNPHTDARYMSVASVPLSRIELYGALSSLWDEDCSSSLSGIYRRIRPNLHPPASCWADGSRETCVRQGNGGTILSIQSHHFKAERNNGNGARHGWSTS